MNIFNKITHLFSGNKVNNSSPQEEYRAASMAQRENILYGEERLSQQKKYEKWMCKETWLLYKEGLPLLYQVEPGSVEGLSEQEQTKLESLLIEIEDCWRHAQDCVYKGLLAVVNVEQPREEWRIKPIDLYHWAIVRKITVPTELQRLMEFVAQTIKPSPQGLTKDLLYQRHREIILGAAMSLLVNVPEACKNSKGQISSRFITRKIIQNEAQWFGDDKSLLSKTAISELIETYLKLGQPLLQKIKLN